MSAVPQFVEREAAFSRHQFDELQATSRWVVNVGGKGSGKTFLDALIILKHSGARPELEEFLGPVGANRITLGGLFANDYQQLATAILAEVFKVLDLFEVGYVFGRQPPPEWVARWKVQGIAAPYFPPKAYASMLILENGHHVFCSQLYQRHYRRLKSFTFGYAIVEEVSEIEKEAVVMVSERVRDRRGPNQLYLHSNPPEGGDHWMYDWRDNLRKASAAGRFSITEITSTTYDNLDNLPSDYVDTISAEVTPEIAEARVLGRWIRSATGRAYSGYDDTESIDGRFDYQPGRPLIFGFDFNWAPASAGVYQLTDSGELRKIDEVYLEAGGGTQPVCDELVRRYAGKHAGSQAWVYWDATGGSHTANTYKTNHSIVRETIGKAFRPVLFKSRTTNPLEADRVISVSAALLNAQGARWFKIHPRCVKSLADYRKVSWIPGTWKLDKTDLKLTHLSDADGYVVCGLRPTVRVRGLSAVRAL